LVPGYLKLKPHCELHFLVAAMLVFVGDAPSTEVSIINPETVMGDNNENYGKSIKTNN